jgi:ABC-2 type transport system permease protein
MRGIALFLPPSYVFEGMRALLAGRSIPLAMLAEGSALAVVELLLAGLLYARVYRHAVRTGLLARYSAESAA